MVRVRAWARERIRARAGVRARARARARARGEVGVLDQLGQPRLVLGVEQQLVRVRVRVS